MASKVELSLFLIHYISRHKMAWRYRSTHFLTLAIDGGECSVSQPGRFPPPPGEITPITQRIGDYLAAWRGEEFLRHEGVWGSGCIDPHFLDLGTGWR
jgi:hypothetical protein